ncbi:MAG: outer membrane protein assembly factor BamD [Bacteroidota bacterium]
MRKGFRIILIFSCLAVFFSCKTEFEKVRTSGDPKLLLETANKYFDEGEYQKAQTLYELIIPVYRGQKELEDIYYRYAYTYYNLESYILAAYYFENFGQTFGASPRREEIDFMAAYSNYQLSPTFRLDQQYTITAIDKLQTFINTYSSSDKVEQANGLIDELRKKLERKAFESGKLYYEVRQYASALQSLENLLKDFPETKRAAEVRYYIILATFEYAENSVIDKQEERYQSTLELGDAFISKYSDSEFINEVRTIRKKAEIKLDNIKNDDRYKVQGSVYRS